MNGKKVILLPAKTYEKLQDSAQSRRITAEQLLQKIVLENTQRRGLYRKSCHQCGLEDAEKPGYPSVDGNPCAICNRNPLIRDRWNEAWTLNEKSEPFVER